VTATRVQSTIVGTTTTFTGNYYEVSGDSITKYYYAGTQRVPNYNNVTINGTLTGSGSDGAKLGVVAYLGYTHSLS